MDRDFGEGSEVEGPGEFCDPLGGSGWKFEVPEAEKPHHCPVPGVGLHPAQRGRVSASVFGGPWGEGS